MVVIRFLVCDMSICVYFGVNCTVVHIFISKFTTNQDLMSNTLNVLFNQRLFN